MGLQSLTIRQMHEGDPPAIAIAFADMNKTRGQYERYWQENLEGKRVTREDLVELQQLIRQKEKELRDGD